MTALVRREDRRGSAVLTLDSPGNRNALSKSLVSELAAHLTAAADDLSVRAVALTATGTTFCSGADLADPPVDSGPGSYVDILRHLSAYPKPVVAAVNGHVRAGGLGLVASADVVLCAASASFAFTEVRLGLVPAIISVPCLARMPRAAARRYMLTGERFGPADAERAGLVTRVVDDAGLPGELDTLLGEFRLCEPEALQATRDLLRMIPGMEEDEAFDLTQTVSQRFFGSAQAAEGIASFREKRAPAWAAEQ